MAALLHRWSRVWSLPVPPLSAGRRSKTRTQAGTGAAPPGCTQSIPLSDTISTLSVSTYMYDH